MTGRAKTGLPGSQAMTVILITGTSTGIGRSAVQHLAATGVQVVATARRLRDIEDLAADNVDTLELDVTDEVSMREAVDTTVQRHGRIDVLVNNAGYGAYLTVEDTDLAAMHRMFDVNVYGPHRLTQMVLPHMRDQAPGPGNIRGRIINVSSIAGHVAIPMMGAYCASKFALRAMTTALDGEVRQFGIRAILVEPGRILTEFGHRAKAERQSHADDGPYGPMYRRWHRIRLNEKGAKPDVIARAVRKAALRRRPRFHYFAPLDSRTTNILKRLLPDRLINAVVRRYVRPRPRDMAP